MEVGSARTGGRESTCPTCLRRLSLYEYLMRRPKTDAVNSEKKKSVTAEKCLEESGLPKLSAKVKRGDSSYSPRRLGGGDAGHVSLWRHGEIDRLEQFDVDTNSSWGKWKNRWRSMRKVASIKDDLHP